jgi:polyphenol oxidase
MSLPIPDPAFRWSAEPWGYALRCGRLESVAQHLFTTRQLQLRAVTLPDRPENRGEAVATAPEAVPSPPLAPHHRAWRQAAASLGADIEQVMRIKQVHGRTVRVLRRGESSAEEHERRPEADAIVSNQADLVLAVQVADCVPLLMADRRSGAAGAVHAGWRGTCVGIAGAAVGAMAREFGTRPADLVVAVGPSIGACCYEVGPELLDAFRAAGADAAQIARWFAPTAGGNLRLDLWTANRDQMHAAGVREDRILLSGLCTQTHAGTFHSFRADGAQAGRMAALIRVPESEAGRTPFGR